MTRFSRAASTTSLVTDGRASISRIRSTCVRGRFSSWKLPPVIRMIEAAAKPYQSRQPEGRPLRASSGFQQLPNLACRQRTEFKNEANAGVQPRIASKALFNAWHNDQNHSNPAPIENASCLLQSGDLEPVGFVNDQQRGRIGDQSV
jgi:hypothetical protein